MRAIPQVKRKDSGKCGYWQENEKYFPIPKTAL
jgi:hypothetical protein